MNWLDDWIFVAASFAWSWCTESQVHFCVDLCLMDNTRLFVSSSLWISLTFISFHLSFLCIKSCPVSNLTNYNLEMLFWSLQKWMESCHRKLCSSVWLEGVLIKCLSWNFNGVVITTYFYSAFIVLFELSITMWFPSTRYIFLTLHVLENSDLSHCKNDDCFQSCLHFEGKYGIGLTTWSSFWTPDLCFGVIKLYPLL